MKMKLVIINQLIGQLMVLIEYNKIINFVNLCNSSKMMCYNTFKNEIDITPETLSPQPSS